MKHFFLHPDKNDLKEQSDDHTLLPMYERPHDTTEGSEFLDDAIRIEDLPLMYTEESFTTGSLENLL